MQMIPSFTLHLVLQMMWNFLWPLTALRDVLWKFSTGRLPTNSNSIQIKPYSWFTNRSFNQSPCGRLSLLELTTITPSDKARNIGVTFDTHLVLSYHVNDVVKKAFYHLRNIPKIRKYISAETTEILIHCFVTSKLDFLQRSFIRPSKISD